ncbi:MAG: T9SS type A sorting domain-containing protein [Bacteroidales bacterium]|jgi:hypothetical protein|nr:T9SS type A sorting domain-containing protein [Bacteroidales bacterium]
MNKHQLFSKLLIAAVLAFAIAFGAQAYSDGDFKQLVMYEILEDEKGEQEAPFRTNNSISPKIELFPNPAHNVLNVEAKNMKQIEIIDMFGRIVMKKDRCNDTERLDISNLKESLYFIRVTTSDEKVTVAKFIKK